MTKRGRLALLGTVALMELQEQARFERAMARFEPDDDLLPPEADPMASAQSRRMPVEIHQ
jgi:hypothetical protein